MGAKNRHTRKRTSTYTHTHTHKRETYLDYSVLGVRDTTNVRDVDDALHGVRRALQHDELRVLGDDGSQVGRACRPRHVHIADLDVVASGHLRRTWTVRQELGVRTLLGRVDRQRLGGEGETVLSFP